MRRKKIDPMFMAGLEELSTKQLLARLKHLQQCESSLSTSDRAGFEIEPGRGIEFKDTAKWTTAYQQVKQVLSHREHIVKGTALLERRQQRGKRNRTAEKRVGRNKAW